MNRKIPYLVIVVLGAALLAVPSSSPANDAGFNITNFSESRGCQPNTAGTSRPHVGQTGPMSPSTQIRGPWGAMYGRTYYQVQQSIVDWRLPGTSRTLRVHERMVPALDIAARSLEQHLAQGKRYYVYSAGSWVWRTVGGRTQPSEHAFGTAFDVNPAQNPYSRDNYLRTDIPSWFIQSFADAGFCWGGHWVDVKDAMHFSWSGPTVTPGYDRPTPYPPVTGATGYRGSTVVHASTLAPKAGARIEIADVTGEGAPDLVRIEDGGRIEAAGAVGDYGTVALRATTATSSPETTMGDYDLDGRPDAWVPDRSGSTIRFDVWTWESDYRDALSVPTGIPSDAGTLMLGHYDDDFLPDVYAGDGATYEVYTSSSGYASVATRLQDPGSAGWHVVTGDHDVDGRSDVYAVSRGSSPQVRVALATGGTVALNPSIPVPSGAAVGLGDYDGDGRDDLFVLDGSSLAIAFGGWSSGAPDAWFQKETSTPPDAGPECVGGSCDTIGYVDEGGAWTLSDRPRTEGEETEFYYGNPNDTPFMGDWDCDGVDTPGLYRRSDGFVYLRNSNTQGVADLEFFFGNPSDVPLIGDFDGDGCDTVSVFRPSEQRMYIINALGRDNQGLGAADYHFDFGDRGDRPFVGDFDGDGIDEIALHRSSAARIYLKWDLSGGAADASFAFGATGDQPLAGDWNGDGTDTVAVYRESTGNWYLLLSNRAGAADHTIHFHPHEQEAFPVSGRAFP